MKKHFLKIFILFIFFVSPLIVRADFGDLRYEITDVEVSNSKITFKGWAFIHKTNNFVSLKHDTAALGGQMIMMQALDANGNVIETITTPGSDEINYNFYCELFYKDSDHKCEEKWYIKSNFNTCGDDNDTRCYYEDLYFSITFDTYKWNITNFNEIGFKIAVSNNFFELENQKGRYKKNAVPFTEKSNQINYYTALEDVSITNAAIKNDNKNLIEIVPGAIQNKVYFIASKGILMNPSAKESKFKFKGDVDTTYGNWISSYGDKEFLLCLDGEKCSNYTNGRSENRSTDKCYDFLRSENNKECRGSYYYAIYVKKGELIDSGRHRIAVPGSISNSIALARGSQVKPSGKLEINVKNDKKCTITEPIPSKLECNNSGNLSSTCNELTVHTDKGSSVVKIEQTGTVSSVLTPDSIYAGGGVKFGIMYYNNIKWTYVGSEPSDELHNAVSIKMNAKLKDYDTYIAGINVSNLKLGDSNISSGMVKQCFSSNANKDYYGDDGLSVTCIFTFPSSTLGYDGREDYMANSLININNKYYTPLDKIGKFNLTATINGMDRIKESSATGDSIDKEKPWTGTWIDTIDGCEIDIYPLLYNENGRYNFIYRPIDINNPFPNRNAGINWYDWFSIQSNKEKLASTYADGYEYTSTINNSTIAKIKEYNTKYNYLDWDNIESDDSFINNYDYVKRGGS